MNEMVKGTVHIGEKTQEISTKRGMTVLEALRLSGISVYSPCGGNGTCGKCRAVIEGEVSPLCEKEKRVLREKEIAEGVRLSCMCEILGDFTAFVKIDTLEIETKSKSVTYTHAPMLTCVKSENDTKFYTDGGVLLDIGAPDAKNLGLAVDIGTTTVAVYLCDMNEGKTIGVRAFANPQSTYGADVISRIDKIMKNKNALDEQQKSITQAIRRAAKSICEEKELTFADVRAAVIAGNTVMQHIAAGIDPSSIANAPFIAPTLFGEDYSAHELGLLENPKAKAYFAPCFASYVGGDIACGMIAAGLDSCTENALFVDIGTNGEIGLSTMNGLYFCSAAAGPALEGAHIECGMSGITGAVSEISVSDGELVYQTIGNASPIGICGSGIIDAVAAMLETGILDETGCIADESDDYPALLDEDDEGDPIFRITDGVYMTGKDIREVQLAKAAICAGIRTLLEEASLSTDDLDKVVIAGGFGSHIRKESACRMGLIPAELIEKITFAGNTAGAGAVALLLSREARERAAHIRERSTYLELSQNATFMEQYIEEMMFEE